MNLRLHRHLGLTLPTLALGLPKRYMATFFSELQSKDNIKVCSVVIDIT